MNHSNSATDFHLLHELTANARLSAQVPDMWESSDFEWLLTLPAATRGKVGRDLVAGWALQNGASVERVTNNHQHYVQINGQLVQVKLSTLWKTGVYKFQQIRDTDFDFCFCIGISPNTAHAWVVPKIALDQHVIGVSGQHTGSDATETFWMEVEPDREPTWLREFGSSLSDAKQILLD